MYDELVKRLREDAPTALANCDFDFIEGWINEAAEAIEELQAAEKKYLANISALETEIQHLKREQPVWTEVDDAN